MALLSYSRTATYQTSQSPFPVTVAQFDAIIMEAIAATASLIALINAVSATAIASIGFCQNIRDAPAEIKDFSSRMLMIKAELEMLRSCSPLICRQVASPDTFAILRDAVDSTQVTLQALEEACAGIKHKTNGKLRRLRWAYIDKPVVEKLFQLLRNTESSLDSIISLLSLHGQSMILEQLNVLRTDIVSKELQISPQEPNPLQERSVSDEYTSMKAKAQPQSTKADFYEIYGAKRSLICTTGSRYSTYSLALRFKTPLITFLGSRMFSAHVAFRRFELASPSLFPLPQSGLSLHSLVADDSPIISACKRGDVRAVQLLFETRQARPDDVTPDNMTTMKYAIDSGNTALVGCLIYNGAQVNWHFGNNQTSPLQWALQENQYEIARLLVNYGACLAHVSALGWTPASYLWPSWETRPDSAIKYLQLLGNGGSIEWEVFDKWGWTVLHRAAAFGKADEVEALIRLGASPTTCALPLHWMAIHHAVYYGNFETFLVLINPKNGASLASPDARGWTLLHIAASAGHDDIIRHLLSLGADHEHLTLPYMSHMPEQLFNQAFTPAKAAAAQSKERYCRYMEALVSFGLKDPQEDQACDWASDGDEFVDALDTLPILQ